MKKLLILGGGFAGVWAAMSAAAETSQIGGGAVKIKLISKNTYLTIRPRLYEGAQPDMRVPLEPLLAEIGVEFQHAEVEGLDAVESTVRLLGGQEIPFDRLILATGSQLQTPAIPGANAHCFSIDTFDDAERLDRHLVAINNADATDNTIVVIGASFTGLEVATEFRRRLGDTSHIVLIDRSEIAGAQLGPTLQGPITQALSEGKIETRLGSSITEILPEAVTLNSGEVIATKTIVVATGMEASPLTRSVPGETDSKGRLMVDATLRVKGAETVFAAGDTAHAMATTKQATLMSCQHAMPLGLAAGRNAVRDLLSKPLVAYSQEFYATCLDLGTWGAVFATGWDRQIDQVRAEGKAMKQEINGKWIYPPSPVIGRDAIFEFVENAICGFSS